MAMLKPLPPKPQNKHLADAIEQIHDCLESFKNEATGQINTLGEKLDTHITVTNSDLSKIKEAQENFSKALGMALGMGSEDNPKPKKSVALMGQVELAAKLTPVVIAGVGFWKFLAFIWPALINLFTQINTYVVK